MIIINNCLVCIYRYWNVVVLSGLTQCVTHIQNIREKQTFSKLALRMLPGPLPSVQSVMTTARVMAVRLGC